MDFSIPTQTIACEAFIFRPQSEEDLTFTITDPNGTTLSPDSEGNFTLGLEGTYQ
ncbi:hypothetical protein QWY93_18895 [Echinicola jeungdonensis]|nr:hypothetical protein [Echinicola jeungdonensis]MDN3671338.1 hypothetical protein [Echinicola jeungdonensis]